MVKCENCGKNVNRRTTYKDGRKVCKKCEGKLESEDFRLLARFITRGKWQRMVE